MPDNSFDVVLSALGLMYVPNPELAIGEMHRTLKEGGTAAAAVWGQCPLFFQLGTGDSLKNAFERAGFRQIRSERIKTALGYPNAEAALTAAFAGGPVALAYSRFDDQTRNEAHAEYLDSIAAFRNSDGRYGIPGEFVVVAGVKPKR